MFSSNTTQVSAGGYQISRSLRFNSADSAYLNRTPASATNRKTWTWSGWVKRSALNSSGENALFIAGTSLAEGTYFNIAFSSDKFVCGSGAAEFRRTTAVYRDVSAWYHLVVAVDTTQATAANRVRMYVNGVEVTAFDTNVNPTQNTDLAINSTVTHNIGRNSFNSSNFFSGYITEVNFIDGQALTPSSFGETNAQTGVWQPKAYSGSYGTNGFYLNFSDNSNTTAATLGKDYSGNGNNWTPNNFSVTAGSGNDSLVDSPTSYGTDTGVGGTVRGNYCTINPLYGSPAPTNGNLDITLVSQTVYGSMSFTSGKWYWETTATNLVNDFYLGVMDSTFIKTDSTWGVGTSATYVSNGTKYGMGGSGAYGATYTTGDVIGFALDLDAGTMVFYKNGVSQGTAFTGMTGREWRPMLYSGNGSLVANFGQRPFAYTAPSGFKALCTQNLPTPTIGATTATQANKYFNVVLRNGAGSAGGTFSTTVNMANGALLWDKTRNLGGDNLLTDSVRGISKYLVSNSTGAEGTDVNYVTAFGTNSYTVGSSDWPTDRTVVDWMWAANGSGSTNTAGSITSTVSANTTSGFSVLTCTTQSSGTGTVGHGLGVAPAMIIVKQRANTSDWNVYHTSIGAGGAIRLNQTSATNVSSVYWNDTAPTSTVFTFGAGFAGSVSMVAYCFAPIAGYSAFGSYTGNDSSDGPFVYTGFRTAYFMVKRTDTSGFNWIVYDTTRDAYNVAGKELIPNSSVAEATYPILDFLSNGFKIRINATSVNASGGTYIYMCFASNPFKYSLAR